MTASMAGAGFDDLFDSGGNDQIEGGLGKDEIFGGAGNDSRSGGSWDDTILGGSGDDDIVGGNSNDTLEGGSGQDFIEGGNGFDRLRGGDDADLLDGGSGGDRIAGQEGNDILLGGDNGDPSGNFVDFLFGGDGNDLLMGQEGRDSLDGGAGDDILIGSNVATLSPEALALQRGEITEAQLTQPIIMLEEENGPDMHSDTLVGGTGSDLIILGGYDVATGAGTGADTYIVGIDWIPDDPDGAAKISDFNLDGDTILLGYDEDDEPPVISYGQAGTSAINVFADGKLVLEVTRFTGIGLGLSDNEVDARIEVLPINPADGQ